MAKDLSKAFSLDQQACGGDTISGRTPLGEMYQKGEGVKADLKKAAELYRWTLLE